MGGADKGLLEKQGMLLIARVIENLGHAAQRLAISANRNLAVYGEYATVLVDHYPGFPGPCAGVLAGLRACRTSWLITVPIDTTAPLEALCALLLETAKELDRAIVAHDGAHRQPLFAAYPARLEESAMRLVSAKADRALHELQDHFGCREAPFGNPGFYCNINGPEQLHQPD